MANWKKMAEAFGRATRRAEKPTAPDNKAVYKESLRINDDDVERAFNKGYDDGAEVDAKFNALKSSKDENARDVMQHSDVETRTDKALWENREKEWDDAFKQSTDKFKSQSSALTDEDADAWKSELLRTIDVLRKRGFSDADILNTIKGN